MMTTPANEDSDEAWVATFAESEDRDVTVTPFREGGVFTASEGFTLRFGRGSEFQVTVVRSK